MTFGTSFDAIRRVRVAGAKILRITRSQLPNVWNDIVLSAENYRLSTQYQYRIHTYIYIHVYIDIFYYVVMLR